MYQSGKGMANWQRFAPDASQGYVALSVREGVPAAAGRRAAEGTGGGSAGPMAGCDFIVVGFSAVPTAPPVLDTIAPAPVELVSQEHAT